MPKIFQLPPHIISQIAAGEVIERPASVVKELIENSLDAGARNIKVEIEKGGFRKIVVTDDGQGMEKEDLAICFKAHTTSKISVHDDLFKINSLGFRGEALSSIAAVSLVHIKSRAKGEPLGNSIVLAEGKLKELYPIGMPQGTQIMVEALFKNIPARRNFLKEPGTEFYHIVEIVSQAALAFPLVSFYLIHNGKEVLRLPEKQSIEERISLILGKKVIAQFFPLTLDLPHLKMNGFIGRPEAATSSRNKQFIFVNSRQIRNLAIFLAVKEAYKTLIEPKLFPVFILFLQLPPENLEINVHPRKEEVKFLNQADLTQTISETIKELFKEKNLIFRPYAESKEDSYQINDHSLAFHEANSEYIFKKDHTARVLRDNTELWSVKEKIKEEEILQIQNIYLVTENEEGILIVDQHAAHERILYEQFLRTFDDEKKRETYFLPEAKIIDLPIREAAYLEANLAIFNQLGFEIENFGKMTFKITAIPHVLKGRELIHFILEVLEDLKEGKNLSSVDSHTKRIISYLACRSAIKAGDYLTPEERKKLVDKLHECHTLYTCPHGRPLKVEIRRNELDGMFRRR